MSTRGSKGKEATRKSTRGDAREKYSGRKIEVYYPPQKTTGWKGGYVPGLVKNQGKNKKWRIEFNGYNAGNRNGYANILINDLLPKQVKNTRGVLVPPVRFINTQKYANNIKPGTRVEMVFDNGGKYTGTIGSYQPGGPNPSMGDKLGAHHIKWNNDDETNEVLQQREALNLITFLNSGGASSSLPSLSPSPNTTATVNSGAKAVDTSRPRRGKEAAVAAINYTNYHKLPRVGPTYQINTNSLPKPGEHHYAVLTGLQIPEAGLQIPEAGPFLSAMLSRDGYRQNHSEVFMNELVRPPSEGFGRGTIARNGKRVIENNNYKKLMKDLKRKSTTTRKKNSSETGSSSTRSKRESKPPQKLSNSRFSNLNTTAKGIRKSSRGPSSSGGR